MSVNVALLDYGSGNIRSAYRALEEVGAKVTVSHSYDEIRAADGLVVPGVGAYAACMNGIKAVGGQEIINHFISSQKPVLGICVGMQVFFEQGMEHGELSTGLGIFPGSVEKLEARILPHMGWNTVNAAPNSRLFQGISSEERVYFVHSYGVKFSALAEEKTYFPTGALISTTIHECEFIAAIEHDNVFATQFHPEKSGIVGQKILSNWVHSR